MTVVRKEKMHMQGKSLEYSVLRVGARGEEQVVRGREWKRGAGGEREGSGREEQVVRGRGWKRGAGGEREGGGGEEQVVRGKGVEERSRW